jgi:glycosyltransferase involved in cell wall biosynthesis
MSTAIAPTCLFFARVRDESLLQLVEFYSEDMRALSDLGFTLRTETSNRGVLRSARPDVAYLWWHHSSLPSLLWLRLRRVPVVVTGAWHVSDEDRTWRDAPRLFLSRISARLATINVAISDVEFRDMSVTAGGRVVKIPLSVDTAYYEPDPAAQRRVDAVTVGQLNPISIRRKGIDLAIASVPHIVARVPDFRLHVIGPATSEGEILLQRLIAESDADHITIEGRVSREEKRRILQSSAVYIQVSRIEGFGLAALEALACGLPVVHSGRGSLDEVVGDGGVLVSQATPEAVAEGVLSLLLGPSPESSWSSRARAQAETLSSAVRLSRLRDLFKDIRTPV